MGRLVNQNLGLSLDMLKFILSIYEEELLDENMSNDRRRFIIICGATFMILFAGALRGGEVLMMEGLELVRRRNGGRNDTENGHVVIPLMGRFKNETGQRNLVLVLANVSVGGLEIRKWVDRLSELLLQEGRGQVMCPAICDENGYLIERWK
jgi:hypothetical protein